MTPAAQQVLETFEALPDDDQQVVAAEILRRTLADEYLPLDDADLTLAAEQIFLELDRREESA